MDKENVGGGNVCVCAHTCTCVMEYYLAIKRMKPPFSAAGITLSEVSQENDKYHMISIGEI